MQEWKVLLPIALIIAFKEDLNTGFRWNLGTNIPSLAQVFRVVKKQYWMGVIPQTGSFDPGCFRS